MSNNKNNIVAIVILSAVILLLCILCVTLVYEGKKERFVNNTSPTYSTTEALTEKTTTTAKPIQPQTQHSTKPTAPTINPTQPTAIDIEIITTPTEATTEILTETQSEKEPTEAETENTENNLVELIKNSGFNLKEIESANIEQLIVITGDTVDIKAYMFTLSDNKWEDKKITCKAYVGSAGIGEKGNDHDNITPKGLYMIGDAFYTTVQPSTWLNTFVITENTYWITDINSDMYNKKVEIEQGHTFENAIHMIDKPNNKYGCVINYNTNPVVRGKGSAIFMHCGTEKTNGSISINESDLLKFLELLNSEKKPAILIF